MERHINSLIGEKVMGYQWFTYEGRKEDGTVTFKFKGLAPSIDYWDRQFEITKEHNYLVWVDEEPKDLKFGSYHGANFSGNLFDAWLVVEKMNEYGDFTLYKGFDSSKWIGSLALSTTEIYSVSEETVQMTICKLALNVFNK